MSIPELARIATLAHIFCTVVRAFDTLHLLLMKASTPQRDHPLHEGFNSLRWIMRVGAERRMLLNEDQLSHEASGVPRYVSKASSAYTP